nr:hypothetical protein [Tanacetum cinerariifolium]
MATLTDMMSKLVSANTASSFGLGTLLGNTITNPKEELKGIATRSSVAYQGPKTPSPSKQGTKVTKDQVQTPSSQNTAPVQPLVIQSESQASVSEPVVAPVSASMPNLKPSILYPSRRNNEKRRDQANEQIEKFYEIFKEMSFEISFTDALILMPKFASTLKALIENKEKLSEMARTMMNEHWLSLPELTLTCMTLELADRLVSKPIGITKDVSFKVRVFHFPADFVVTDFEPDLRVLLILERCFLKTSRALIDVHKGELTLRIGNEAITYNLDQTARYSANYNQMTANKIDVIESACEEYSQEVLSFSNVTTSETPTPQNDPIVFATSLTLIAFGDSDFLLFKEADTFLGLEDDPDSLKVNPFYYDPEGYILLLEAILNSEPSPPLPNQEQNLPSFKEELKAYEAQTVKSSVDEPPEVELKDLPHHLEYAFLEGDNKFPIIIAKELGRYQPEFCTHKILMEEDYKLAVQHQRQVNPKIHDIIKKEVEKLLDVGLIYPISDSPWVSPFKEELKAYEAQTVKSFVDEPLEVELKDLPHHLEYAFLEGDNKLPVIIAKELISEEKAALIKVLKSHKKLSTFSKLAIMGPRGDIMVQISLLKRSLIPVSSGPPFTKMPTNLLKIVTRANDKGKFHNEMRCLKIPSKLVKSLTFRALILWARSRLHEGTNIFSWLSTTCQNGLKRKRSPPTTPVLFANSLNLSLPDLVHLELS